MADDTDTVDLPDTTQSPVVPSGESPDAMARWGGGLLLITAVVTAVMVYARVASNTDLATIAESLRAIGESQGLYTLFGVARLVSGVTLLIAGWFLSRTWIIRDRWATPWVPYLFMLSGACTAVSGAAAMWVAFQAGAPSADTVTQLNWLVGKAGFTFAGLALLVAAWFQWTVGGTLRKVAPASVVLGVAMQFIWLEAAAIVHPIVGGVFFLWLIVIGAMLATGRVERHFVDRYGNTVA